MIQRRPVIARNFLRWFAEHLEGSPPASMMSTKELRQPQGFLNGHSADGIYSATLRIMREEEVDGDAYSYLLDKTGIAITPSDIFAASQLDRTIPWERVINRPILLAFLEELRQREIEASSKNMPPVSMWNRDEFKKQYRALNGKSPFQLFNICDKEGKERNMGPIPVLHEKLGITPQVDDVIETALMGRKISPRIITPVIVEGILTRAADQLEIDISEIKDHHLRDNPFHFFGDQTLNLLLQHAKRHKAPDQTAMQFLLEAALEVRKKRKLIRAREIVRKNRGVLAYIELDQAGILREDETAIFDGGTDKLLQILDVRRPHIVFPAPDTKDRKMTATQRLRLLYKSEWYESGNCRGRDVNQFAKYKLTDTQVEAAKELCHTCPVREHCELAGHLSESYGVWGGTTFQDRKRIKAYFDQTEGGFEGYLRELPMGDIVWLQSAAQK